MRTFKAFSLATILIISSLSSARAEAPASFSFTGSGYGHGVGMIALHHLLPPPLNHLLKSFLAISAIAKMSYRLQRYKTVKRQPSELRQG